MCVFGLWHNVYEKYSEIRNYDSSKIAQKEQLDKYIFVQNNKIYFKNPEQNNTSGEEKNISKETCPKCGNVLTEGMKFCPKCGQNLKDK